MSTISIRLISDHGFNKLQLSGNSSLLVIKLRAAEILSCPVHSIELYVAQKKIVAPDSTILDKIKDIANGTTINVKTMGLSNEKSLGSPKSSTGKNYDRISSSGYGKRSTHNTKLTDGGILGSKRLNTGHDQGQTIGGRSPRATANKPGPTVKKSEAEP